MLVTKIGLIIKFSCDACGCEFQIGSKQKDVNDHAFEGNYYYACPCCGNKCHSTTKRWETPENAEVWE